MLFSLGLTSTINQSFSHVLRYFAVLTKRAKDPFKTSSDTASKILEIATQKLFEQTKKLVNAQARLREEYKRYQDLFEFIPNAYLVGDTQGKIQSANCATATLFNLQLLIVSRPWISHK